MADTSDFVSALDRAHPTGLPDHLRKLHLGQVLAGHLPQQLVGKVPATRTGELSTVLSLGLPYWSRAQRVLRATVRTVGSGSVLGELSPINKDVTPSTGEVGVTPSGDIAFLGTDAATLVDVTYVPVAGDVVELTLPAPAGVLTLPAAVVARNPLLLLEATATAGTNLGRKIVLAPAAAVVATTKAALAINRGAVYFNFATDAVTAATVKILVAPASGLAAVLAGSPDTL